MNPLKNYGPALVIASAFLVSAWMMMPVPAVNVTVPVPSMALMAEAAPEPENETERRLFKRIDARVDARAGGLVAQSIANVLDEAEQEFNRPMMSSNSGKPQGIFSVLGLKLVDLMKRVAKWVVEAVVAAAIIALAIKFWPWLVGGFMAAVTLVATPAGWAAGRKANGK